MTAWSNNFNGIASGTTVTTSNSGGVSGTAFNATQAPTGGSLTSDSAAAFEGATGLQIAYPNTSQAGYVFWTISGATVGTRLSVSFWYRVSALPAVTARVMDMSGNLIQLNSSGQFLVGAGVTSAAVTAGTWVFIQYAATANASTTGGRLEAVITTAGGSTLLSYDSGSTVNAGTGSYTNIYFGRSAAVTAPLTASYDLLNVSNVLTSGFPGALALAGAAAFTPTVALTATRTVSLSRSAALTASAGMAATRASALTRSVGLTPTVMLTATRTAKPTASAALAAAVALTATRAPAILAHASLTASATLTDAGTPKLTQGAALGGSISLTAGSVPAVTGRASFTLTAALTAAGVQGLPFAPFTGTVGAATGNPLRVGAATRNPLTVGPATRNPLTVGDAT